jgi:hypothetical protein
VGHSVGCVGKTDPHLYLPDVLTKLVKDWPMSLIDELLPRAYVTYLSGGGRLEMNKERTRRPR